LAKAFQRMLEDFSIEERILAVNGDNASTNDTQMTALADMDNSFEEENRVRCFNHTLQLSATTLIRPFNVGMTPLKDSEDNSEASDDLLDLEEFESDDDNESVDVERDDIADGIDEFVELGAAEKEIFLGDTADVRATISKVSSAAGISLTID
jgi:hypothetical protein